MATNGLNNITSIESESCTFDKPNNDECRLCFSDTKSDFLNLFQSWAEPWDDMAPTIAEDLYRLANIHVTELDIHSKVICCKCYIKLREACQFVRYIQKNNSMLKHKLMNNEFKLSNIETEKWPEPDASKNINDFVNYSHIEVEVKKEIITEEEDNVNNGYADPELEIKIEPEEFQEQDKRSIKVSYDVEFSDSDSRLFEPEFLDNTLREEEPTDRAESEVPETQVPISECMLCSRQFKTLSGLKAHVVSQHSYKSVKRKADTDSLLTPETKKKRSHVCSICSRSFPKSSDLTVHNTWCYEKAWWSAPGKGASTMFVSLDNEISRTTRNESEINIKLV